MTTLLCFRQFTNQATFELIFKHIIQTKLIKYFLGKTRAKTVVEMSSTKMR